jgi:hypothetical protein
MSRQKLYLCITLIFALGCDLEKYTGYRYDSEPLPVTAQISGTVINIFTAEPVSDARIQIGDQTARSDSGGRYLLNYPQTTDNLRGLPVIVEVSADRFYTLDTSIIVYPTTRLDPNLTYGAPAIKRSALVDGICQVIVFDYQGAQDISSVLVNFFYRRPGERTPSLKIEKSLSCVMTDSFYYGFYQTIVDTSRPGYGQLINSYLIKATDKEFFSDSTSNTAVEEPTLLFPPSL